MELTTVKGCYILQSRSGRNMRATVVIGARYAVRLLLVHHALHVNHTHTISVPYDVSSFPVHGQVVPDPL